MLKSLSENDSVSSNDILSSSGNRKPRDSHEESLQEAILLLHAGDIKRALQKFIKLIDHGCDEAYLFAASIYEIGGPDVPQDYEKAIFYYQKNIETFGSVEAHLGLARCYYFGRGVTKDYCKAFDHYSAVEREKRNAVAYLMLGRMYQYGQCVKRDVIKAKVYFKKAYDLGYPMGLACLGFLEQESGNYIRGLYLRVKAGVLGYRIALRDRQDPRLRGS